MSDDSDLEKSHPASPQRLEQARAQGQVPRSRELSTLVMLAAGWAGLWLLADALELALSQALRRSLAFTPASARDGSQMLEAVGAVLMQGGLALLPLLALLLLAAVTAPLLLGGWNVSAQAMAPRWSRLDPVQGLVRLCSTQGLAELGKALAKAVLVASVSAWALWQEMPALLALLHEPLAVAVPACLRLVAAACAWGIASLLLLALIDVPWQLWTHHKNLRMTLEEVRKEHKESEGDPHIKAQLRRQRQQMARRRMMAEVPRADVVLTNPTHYAVALRYDDAMRAPQVVAKGRDALAERIKALALEHRVPLLQAPPLARALHRHTALGEEIPGALYTAVAEVLAWAMQLRRAPRGQAPAAPADLPVPADMDPLHGACGDPGGSHA